MQEKIHNRKFCPLYEKSQEIKIKDLTQTDSSVLLSTTTHIQIDSLTARTFFR